MGKKEFCANQSSRDRDQTRVYFRQNQEAAVAVCRNGTLQSKKTVISPVCRRPKAKWDGKQTSQSVLKLKD